MNLHKQSPQGLERYLSVVRGEALARHRLLRSIPVDVKLDDEDEKLWEAHDRLLTEFRRILAEGNDYPPSQGPNLLDLKIELASRMMQNCIICEKRPFLNNGKYSVKINANMTTIRLVNNDYGYAECIDGTIVIPGLDKICNAECQVGALNWKMIDDKTLGISI